MAANITLSNFTCDSTGKQWTYTLNGGTGTGYGPSIGATGVFPKSAAADALQFHIVSHTISGDTGTIISDTPISSAMAAVFSTLASSNITDSGGNTLQAQTNVAATNTSNRTANAYALTSANLAALGMTTGQAGTSGGRGYATALTASFRVEFTSDATDIYLPLLNQSGAASILVSIDGAAAVSVAATNTAGTTWGAVPIANGQTGTHSYVVTYVNACFPATTEFVYAFGGTISPPANYGKPYLFFNVGSFINIAPAQQRSTPRLYGYGCGSGWEFKTTGGSSPHTYRVVPILQPGNPCESFNFMLTTNGELRMYGAMNGGQYELWIDGVPQSTLSPTLATGGARAWVTLFTGLDATTVNESATWVPGRSFFQRGDSITYVIGTNGNTDNRTASLQVLARQYGIWGNNYGTSGAPVPSTMTGLVSASIQPTDVILAYGTNNLPLDTVQATFISTYQSLLTSTRSAAPSAKIWVRAILTRFDAQASKVATYNSYIQQAIANVGDANTQFYDPSTGLTSAMVPDGLHPNNVGQAQIAANEAVIFGLAASNRKFRTSMNAGFQTFAGGFAQ